jgi:hypothetical protein
MGERRPAASTDQRRAYMTATGDPVEVGDLGGYAIRATDGEIGRVDRSDMATGVRYLVVATGPWIFGRIVLLPASVIERIDHDNQVVHVNCTKDHVKNAPEYRDDESHHADLEDYYTSIRLGPLGGQV